MTPAAEFVQGEERTLRIAHLAFELGLSILNLPFVEQLFSLSFSLPASFPAQPLMPYTSNTEPPCLKLCRIQHPADGSAAAEDQDAEDAEDAEVADLEE